MSDSTSETLAMVRDVLAKSGNVDDLAKATGTFTQPSTAVTGLQPYDLEAPAKNLVPWLSPLRNRIARVSGRGGIQANWKAVTSVNSTQMSGGIAEGRRGGLMDTVSADYLAAYRTIGLEASVTFEAQLAGGDYDDLRARAQTSLLQAMMVEEEKIILGGNNSLVLTQPAAPTCTTATSGGALASGVAVTAYVVALGFDAYRRTTVAGGVHQTYSRANQDGTTETVNGGTSLPSTVGTVSTAGGGALNTVTMKTTPVRGAVGYAWYASTVGIERLFAVTTSAQATLTALPIAPNQLFSALAATDYSKDGLIFDGLLTMAMNSTLNSQYKALANGGTLTADGAGGIVEFDDMLQLFWDNLRIVPDRLLIGSQEARSLKKIITQGGTTASLGRFTFQQIQGQMVGGGNARGYLTTFGDQREIPFEQHPYMPAGTCLFLTETLPYPMNNVNNVMQIRARRDYYSMEWPLKTRSYEYGVYSDEVLQHYFPPSMGVITNIAAS